METIFFAVKDVSNIFSILNKFWRIVNTFLYNFEKMATENVLY